MCNKIGFASRGEAKAYARDHAAKGKLAGALHPYECLKCPDWHLTHFSPRESRRIAKRCGRR